MTKEKIDTLLRSILLEKGVLETQLTYDAHLEHDLGLDSLDLAELIMDIEREFKISVAEEEWEKVTTYIKLVAYVATKNQMTQHAIQ